MISKNRLALLIAKPFIKKFYIEPATIEEIAELAARVFQLETYLDRLLIADYQTGEIEEVASESRFLIVRRE